MRLLYGGLFFVASILNGMEAEVLPQKNAEENKVKAARLLYNLQDNVRRFFEAESREALVGNDKALYHYDEGKKYLTGKEVTRSLSDADSHFEIAVNSICDEAKNVLYNELVLLHGLLEENNYALKWRNEAAKIERHLLNFDFVEETFTTTSDFLMYPSPLPPFCLLRLIEIIDMLMVRNFEEACIEIGEQKEVAISFVSYAASKGFHEALELFILNGWPIMVINKSGWTALHYAVFCGQKDCFDLIRRKYDAINTNYKRLMIVLHLIINRYSELVINSLIETFTKTTSNDKPVLFKLMLSKIQNGLSVTGDFHGRDESRQTTLIAAHHDLGTIYFFGNGVDQNFVLSDQHFTRALCLTENQQEKAKKACEYALLFIDAGEERFVVKWIEMVRFLTGVDFAASLQNLLRLGDISKEACSEIDTTIVDDSGNNSLHLAVKVGDTNLVRLLMEKGFKIDSINKFGRTPLHHAARDAQGDMIRLLLSKGAQINIQGWFGGTPLSLASRKGNKCGVVTLLSAGADPNIGGWTPLQAAADKRHFEILETLFCSDKIKKECHQGILHFAARRGDYQLVEYFIRKGFDVSARKVYSGETPLHCAVICHSPLYGTEYESPPSAEKVERYTKVIQLLLDNGADINAHNGSGKTPLAVAKEHAGSEIATYLEARGAK